ncbi:MAG: hypothetical protein ACXWXV_00360 [Aeromicrobium sp.]
MGPKQRAGSLSSISPAGWPRRRRAAVLVLMPVMAALFVVVSGTPVGDASVAWLLLVAVAATLAAAVLASYLPRKSRRMELGCTPCAAMSALTVVGAMMALKNFGSMLIGPALAIAVTLFGLTQRIGQAETCSVPVRTNTPDDD